MNLKLITHNNVQFWASPKQAKAIDLLQDTRSGFATIHNYVSTSNYVTPQTATINFIMKFSTERMYLRAIESLENMKFSDVQDEIKNLDKASGKPAKELEALFNDRKRMLIESMQKTLDGDRSDAHRQAHDRCYAPIAAGIKVHFKTLKGVDGLMEPVMLNGFPVVESIMIHAIEVSKQILEAGEYKQVNSGLPVLVSDIIKSHMPRSTKIKQFSLKEDNFTSLAYNNTEIVPDDIAGLFT